MKNSSLIACWIGFVVTVLPTSPRAADRSPPKLPPGYVIVASSISPGHKFGVSAFDNAANPPPDKIVPNQLIDLESGRVVGVIDGMSALTHMPHGGILPTIWANDESFLLWRVDGKWSPDTIVLVQIKDGGLKAQTDLLHAIQQKLLALTRRASPQQFAAAKKANAGNGVAYPEGFTIDVEVSDSLSFPLQLRAILTSDPKAPRGAAFRSFLEALVNEEGQLRVTHFQLGHADSPHFD